MFGFFKKQLSQLKEAKDSKYLIELTKLLAPLTETLPMLVLIKKLSKKKNFLIRNSPFIWGYLNKLGQHYAKIISLPATNHSVLLQASLELYASMFLIDVEIAHKEYTDMHRAIKNNKAAPNVPVSAKVLFYGGAKGCVMDMEQIGKEVPNRMHPLTNLHIFLHQRYKQVEKK